jgi:ribosomal protein S18 acetylase RimI-like enzyme
MQALALEQRRLLGPRAPWHAGDLAWGLRQHAGREYEWRIRLWEEDGAVVAWSWLKGATGKLELVMAAWPYRGSLDCVVEAPDGRFAAYCLVWPEDENSVGELEPVGVREEFRRRGLGAAVCTFALRRLWDEGGRQAIVYCAGGPACELYRALGFRRHTSLVGYSR